jgi:hypothetical protein
MRGTDRQTGKLFSYLSPEAMVPQDHPLRVIRPHVAQNDKRRRSAIDGRTTRHAGHMVSQRLRKRIEEVFGWMKTVGGQRKKRYRGSARVGWMFTLSAAAYNLLRMPKLLGAVV